MLCKNESEQRAEMEAVGKADEKGEIRVTPLQLLALGSLSLSRARARSLSLSRMLTYADVC